jgi:hypothetical protein
MSRQTRACVHHHGSIRCWYMGRKRGMRHAREWRMYQASRAIHILHPGERNLIPPKKGKTDSPGGTSRSGLESRADDRFRPFKPIMYHFYFKAFLCTTMFRPFKPGFVHPTPAAESWQPKRNLSSFCRKAHPILLQARLKTDKWGEPLLAGPIWLFSLELCQAFPRPCLARHQLPPLSLQQSYSKVKLFRRSGFVDSVLGGGGRCPAVCSPTGDV